MITANLPPVQRVLIKAVGAICWLSFEPDFDNEEGGDVSLLEKVTVRTHFFI